MGLYWSFTMPLLSTLAALVIIVHSAEEDLEEFRRDLRPRVSDTGTTNYELPWRAVRAEPMMTQSTQTDTWDGSPEEQPKRRRPSRKRRRRPQPSSEIFARQEGYSEQREYPYNGENYRPFTQIPQRRRKKVVPKQKTWANEPLESSRPSRRKGVRRKANADEPWRELSEFGDPPLEEYMETNDANQKPEPVNYEQEFENNDEHAPHMTLNQFFKYDEKVVTQEAKDGRSYEENEDEPAQINKDTEYDENTMLQGKEDKSLSEFSMEINDAARISRNRSDQVNPFKGNFNDLKEQRPLDPSSLKEILKKSKGKSLSELLQQHNLTLADLLNGEKKVLSVLKSSDTLQSNKQVVYASESFTHVPSTEEPKALVFSESKVPENVEETTVINNKPFEITTSESPILTTTNHVIKKVINSPESVSNANLRSMNKDQKFNVSSTNHHNDKVKLNETNKNFLRRRLPIGVRMKLRMRPLNSNSYKGQLSRDLIALSTKKFHHNPNFTKLRDWKDIIPAVVNKTHTKTDEKLNIYNNADEKYNLTSTTASAPVETTVDDVTADIGIYTEEGEMPTEEINSNIAYTTIVPTTDAKTTLNVISTPKPIVSVTPRPNATSLRHQAFTNRLRKKKLRQKTMANETLESLDHKLKDIFDMANLVSASEFIARIHQTPTTTTDESETATMLEDFMATETTTKTVTQTSTKRYSAREKPKTSTTEQPTLKTSTTETAKIEIEEILDDASARDKLSRILLERNMTLSELVEHRERGSSHVHLADIFHNSSKEPNPPEPFLSKSLLEPISKETYPLRALLEANLHDQTVKPTTVEPYLFPLHYINVPIAMDFGNNVNENSENSGIIALFNNFTATMEKAHSADLDLNKSNEEGNNDVANSTSRESRVFNTDQDLISLNEIFSLMQKTRNHRQEPQAVSSEMSSLNKSEADTTAEDIDGDGLIALEDLQHIKNMKVDKGFYTDKVESKLLESIEAIATINTPDTIHNNTRSVTVVTASIVGLIAVLFLVTYAAFKWKHQQQAFRKHCSSEGRIPTPVFESRKSNKNSSMRSLSPMLSSHIYSVNTLEKPGNNECPEYMWDSLRKPFQ